MTIGTARNDDVEIVYETFGPPTGQPLLLVMGTGGQLIAWPSDFCAALVDRGYQVTRFDNRDAGLSTRFGHAGKPNPLRMWLRPASAAVYRLEDMARDAVAVLDAQGWTSAHVAGMSMGGAIAQAMATAFPDRVRTLTSISAAPAPRVGQPRVSTLLKIAKVMTRPVTDAAAFAEQTIDLRAFTGSPDYPTDPDVVRDLARQSYERGGYDLAAVQRQTAAIAASGDRRAQLSRLRVPTLVLHGEADQMIRSVAGRATADAIPGARYVTYPGMGHDLPCQLWPAFIDEIHSLTQQATRR